MKITYLKTIGFRKFEDVFETDLYPVTEITGGNTKGKTNILYAIVWAFLGTNLTGDDKVWLGNKNSDNCFVELHFEDNLGHTHTLARYKNKYNNSKNFLMLDERNAEQKDLQSFYCDKKLFLSILNPNYFLSKKPSEQKAIINSYLPNVDIKVVYDRLDEQEKAYLEGCPKDIAKYIQELNDDKKIYEDKIKNLQGKIEYAQNVIDNTLIEKEKTFEKEEELNLERQQLSFLQNDKESNNKEKQETIVENLNNQILQLENQVQNLDTKMKAGKSKYLSIKNEPISYCPVCKQKIENESKITTIKNMKKELEGYFESKIKLEKQLSDLKGQIMTEKCKLYSLQGISKEEKAKQISISQDKIVSLEQEKLEIEKYNNSIKFKQKSINDAKNDISIFRNNIKELNKTIENIKETKSIAQKLYINYLEEKMKSATIHLKNVSIKYYKVLKEDGVIKEDFIILYNGNELKNLSRSETIACSLELCNMLNKVAKTNLPLFIDDSESCADYNFLEDYASDTQVLISRVQKGQDLKITNYKNEAMQIAA